MIPRLQRFLLQCSNCCNVFRVAYVKGLENVTPSISGFGNISNLDRKGGIQGSEKVEGKEKRKEERIRDLFVESKGGVEHSALI